MVTALQRQRYPRTWIRRVVEFANTGKLGPLVGVLRRGAVAPDAVSAAGLRARVVADLELIAAGAELSDSTVQRLLDGTDGLTITVAKFGKADRELVLLTTADRLEALTSYVTLLLYQARPDERQFPGDLRRCQLESCSRFFFARDQLEAHGGRPVTKFCSREHMLEHHAQSGAERTAKYRQRKADAAKHK